MRYFAHIEVEIEAEDQESAYDTAERLTFEIQDHFVFEVEAAFLVNVEEDINQ